jgi:hypothetical protein
MNGAVQRLDSLTRTLTQTIETADSKGNTEPPIALAFFMRQ